MRISDWSSDVCSSDLAPNLLVQQIDARQYSIGARGFNGYETSNKLLGLIDGRTIYTPLHAGIFWDLREPMLDDLDRIEVISGSGGTLWGTNAVNRSEERRVGKGCVSRC